MIKNADITADGITFVLENAQDMKTFRNNAGIDPYLYHLSSDKAEDRVLKVEYAVPEHAAPVQATIAQGISPHGANILAVPTPGATDYAIRLSFPQPKTAQRLPGKIAAGAPALGLRFQYEDFKEIAQVLASTENSRRPLITEEQRDGLIAIGRESLEARHTLFYPDNKDTRFSVDMQHGALNLNFNKQHPDYDKRRAEATVKEILTVLGKDLSKYGNLSWGVYLAKSGDEPETFREITDILVKDGWVDKAQQASFTRHVRAGIVAQDATFWLRNIVTNTHMDVQLHDIDPAKQLEGLAPIAGLLVKLARDGDFSTLSMSELQQLLAISEIDNYQDRRKQDQAYATRDSLTGRDFHNSDAFSEMTRNFRPDIEAALARHQGTTLVTEDGTHIGLGTSLATQPVLPENPQKRLEFLMTRNASGRNQIDDWAKAGAYDAIRNALAPIAVAGNAENRELAERLFHLIEGNRPHTYRDTNAISMFDSLRGNKKALQAVIETLAANGESRFIQPMAGHLSRRDPDAFVILADTVKSEKGRERLAYGMSLDLPLHSRSDAIDKLAADAKAMQQIETNMHALRSHPDLLAHALNSHPHLLPAMVAGGNSALFSETVQALKDIPASEGRARTPDLSAIILNCDAKFIEATSESRASMAGKKTNAHAMSAAAAYGVLIEALKDNPLSLKRLAAGLSDATSRHAGGALDRLIESGKTGDAASLVARLVERPDALGEALSPSVLTALIHDRRQAGLDAVDALSGNANAMRRAILPGSWDREPSYPMAALIARGDGARIAKVLATLGGKEEPARLFGKFEPLKQIAAAARLLPPGDSMAAEALETMRRRLDPPPSEPGLPPVSRRFP